MKWLNQHVERLVDVDEFARFDDWCVGMTHGAEIDLCSMCRTGARHKAKEACEKWVEKMEWRHYEGHAGRALACFFDIEWISYDPDETMHQSESYPGDWDESAKAPRHGNCRICCRMGPLGTMCNDCETRSRCVICTTHHRLHPDKLPDDRSHKDHFIDP